MPFPNRAFAQEQGRWRGGRSMMPMVHCTRCCERNRGQGRRFLQIVPGVSGNGLRFDGYTTSVVRKAESAPKFHGSFSLQAWVALDTYPWNWIPVVDQEQDRQSGYFFGLDAFGHVSLQVQCMGLAICDINRASSAQEVGTPNRNFRREQRSCDLP